MDILDIDEVLKDDSFCLLEENSHDDIPNILQKWRNNGSTEQGTKFDTRTFTRPKRRSAQNLEPSFVNASSKIDSITPSSNNSNINLQIGGLVTSLQKSFLQDTSPPGSICSSMDLSIDRMNNSLITSADFTNVSFFKTTDDDVLSNFQINGYSLDDVIRDRRALENLTLSGDSTVVKDSNIAQTDEISYVSKTNSGNSTMQNSAESSDFVGLNETYALLNETILESEKPNLDGTFSKEIEGNNKQLITNNANSVIHDDLIINTTFNFIDSMQLSQKSITNDQLLNTTVNLKTPIDTNQTFLKIFDETFEKPFNDNLKNEIITENKDRINGTFDLCEETEDEDNTSKNCMNDIENLSINKNHGTPKDGNRSALKQNNVHSTPQHLENTKKALTDDVNISPIVPVTDILEEKQQQIIESTSPSLNKQPINQLEKYLKELSNNFPNADEQIEIFKEARTLQDNSVLNDLEYFQNDVALLSEEKNEEIFDTILNDFGKTILTEENLKMKRSLDNIKKRYSLATTFEKLHLDDNIKPDHDSFVNNSRLSDSLGKSSLSSSSSSERLLSRRSRLYDDIHLLKPENQTSSSSSSSTGTTLSINSDDDNDKKRILTETDNKIMDKGKEIADLKTELNCIIKEGNTENNIRNEKCRERNRDRFKTIRIFKKPSDLDVIPPCIDQEIENEEQHEQQQMPCIEQNRFTRKDRNSPTTVYRKSEMIYNQQEQQIRQNQQQQQHNIYTTYKKPKESLLCRSVRESSSNEIGLNVENTINQKTISRPKYISGLAKREMDTNDALPKANSAGDLNKTLNYNTYRKQQSNFGTIAKPPSNIKSPMGTKAKSFHNLAGHFGFSSKMSNLKPSSQPSLIQQVNGITNDREKNSQSNRTNRISLLSRPTPAKSLPDGVEKNESTVFKLPNPISNLRQPNSRRTGLARPSSGFYSYNVTKNDSDTESTGRYSPSNSLSSASSKGSVIHDQQKNVNGHLSDDNITTNVRELNNKKYNNESAPAGQHITNTKALLANTPTTTATVSSQASAPAITGIAKPSGLRPPSSIRKSGLPRPSSIIRR